VNHAGIVHPDGACFALDFAMSNLRLASSRKYFNFGGPDDYVVLDDGRAIGRIVRLPGAPKGRPWFWAITASDKPPSKGYAYTREDAMADFKARWLA
jgi:hypothetical protein